MAPKNQSTLKLSFEEDSDIPYLWKRATCFRLVFVSLEFLLFHDSTIDMIWKTDKIAWAIKRYSHVQLPLIYLKDQSFNNIDVPLDGFVTTNTLHHKNKQFCEHPSKAWESIHP